MARGIRVAMVGGGSYTWMPTLIRDIILTPGLEEVEFRLLDINLRAAEEIAALGKRMVSEWKLGATFLPTSDQARAFDGADHVIITISTGGLDAMQHDVHLPERYGIFQTVGDTVGPGGWSRALRNIPVFMQLAASIRAHAPRATIMNYTNPMTTLTKTLTLCVSQPVVGLCHGIFGNYRTLMDIFGLRSESHIKVNFAGINHFFWILDMRINGRDGYEMLARKMKGRTFGDLVREAYVDGHGFYSPSIIAGELMAEYGKLPYVGDRHTCEFFSRYLAPDESKLRRYRIVRTPVKKRRLAAAAARRRVRDMISGRIPIQKTRSRETAADIIAARSLGRELIDVMNVPNRGQVSNLPIGAVVETLGVVNELGFTPLAAGELPPKIQGAIMPHVRNQELIVQAGMEGDLNKAFDALLGDPLCSHLSIPQVKKMGRELMERTRRWLPQFFGKAAARK